MLIAVVKMAAAPWWLGYFTQQLRSGSRIPRLCFQKFADVLDCSHSANIASRIYH